MRIFNRLSPEGIPWKNYKLLEFLLCLPIGALAAIYMEIMWRLSKKRASIEGIENIVNGAIIYDFHRDVMTNYMTMRLLKQRDRAISFIGSHDFFSYTSFGTGSTGAYRSWRFQRRKGQKPFDQIVEFLHAEPNTVLGIFTDGNKGEFDRVRESLVNLVIASRRPVVPFRSLYEPKILLGRNEFPSLFVHGKSIFRKPITPEELECIPLEAARLKLEAALKSLI